jgi:hypothetical protein
VRTETWCCVCGHPVDENVAHSVHEPECDAGTPSHFGCDCDQWAHSNCCQQCEGQLELA